MALYLRNTRKMREQIVSLEKARDRIETEERLVFDFLHTIGEALSADMRAEDLNRVLVEGSIKITEATGGAVYLGQLKGDGVRRGYGTPEATVVFPLSKETEKARDVLATYLRWHTVFPGDGIIGTAWRDGEAKLIPGDDPRLPLGMYSSVMIAPLTFSGQRLGVVYVTRR